MEASTAERELIRNFAFYKNLDLTEKDEKQLGYYIREYAKRLPDKVIIKKEKEIVLERVFVTRTDSTHKTKLVFRSMEEEAFAKKTPIQQAIEVHNEVVAIFECDDLETKSRKQNIVKARQVYCYVAWEVTTATLVQIGEIINRDHTTVVHSRDSIIDWLAVRDPLFMPYWNKYLSEAQKHLIP